MKMNGMEIANQTESQITERKRSDLISKKLGELLLQGYKMLNATCEVCECILMQKKNAPVFCVGCEDKDVLALSVPRQTANSELVDSEIDEEMKIFQMKLQSKLKETTTRNGEHHSSNGTHGYKMESKTMTTKKVQNEKQVESNSLDVLRSKINWAIEELKQSSNVRYNTELCEMIKSASEAILVLRKLEEIN